MSNCGWLWRLLWFGNFSAPVGRGSMFAQHLTGLLGSGWPGLVHSRNRWPWFQLLVEWLKRGEVRRVPLQTLLPGLPQDGLMGRQVLLVLAELGSLLLLCCLWWSLYPRCPHPWTKGIAPRRTCFFHTETGMSRGTRAHVIMRRSR